MAIRLLLAEPSLTTRKVVELAFEDDDLEIAVATTEAQALEQVRVGRPSLVLASYNLPDSDGIRLCRALREEVFGYDVPVILMVAEGEEYDENEARAAGVTARLSKPLDSQELVEIVAQHVVEAEMSAPISPEEAPPVEWEDVEERAPISTGQPAETAPPAAEGQVAAEGEEASEAGEEVAEAPSGDEAVAIGREELEGSEETDFERSLQSLSKDIMGADEASGEPAPAVEAMEPSGGEAGEAAEQAAGVRPRDAGEGIVLEKATDDEMLETLFEGGRGVAAPPSAGVGRHRVGVEEPRPARRRLGAEADIFERIVGRRVWELTEDMIRQSLEETLKRITPEMIAAVRDEVRTLFPALAERIVRDEIDKLKKGLDS